MRPTRSSRPSSPDARTRLLAPLGLLPVLLLAACGGGSGPQEVSAPTPTPLSADAAPATPTPAAPSEPEESEEGAETASDADLTAAPDDEPEVWATFTEEPGRLPPRDAEERFGDDPRVQTVRAFNEEFARAATAGDPQRPGFVSLVAPQGYDALMDYLGEEFGKQYPGPLPFTLLDVAQGEEEGTASVQGCIVSSGFALGAEGMTGQSVTPIEYALVTDPATEGWLVEAIWAGAYDCSTVTVEARAW